jgi:cytochrome c-type biogenesis protein CcmF
MIIGLGHYCLILALCVAVVQAVVPLVGAARGNIAWMNVSRPAACIQFILVGLAFLSLIWSFATSDFSVLLVAENSHTDKPLIYKISGVWGNHEGSMVLWTFILSTYGVAVSLFGGNLPVGLRARALSVQAIIGIGFMMFILFTSSPFLRLYPAPINGNGLNPLLQDPGLAFHPPCLYMGYVGLSMAFSFAIAALLEGRVDAAWARWVRPWTLTAWCFLTLGIGMGSWWAYYTLGWGGWWYWDPVENASFMPWLACTALLHSSSVVEKRDTLKSWTILLAIIAFSFSLLGTFLVRSGILTSVHSFASDPARGVFILGLLLLISGGSLVLFAFRAPAMKGGGLFTPLSREGSLVFNNVILSTAAGTVLLGTLYPLFADVLNLGKVSVGPPFFNTVFGPLMLPMFIAMAIGPLLSWKRGDIRTALARLKYAFIATIVTVTLVIFLAGIAPRSLWAALGLGLAAWLFVGSATEWVEQVGLFRLSFKNVWRRIVKLPHSVYGKTIAHVGVAILLAGITGSLAWQTEKLQVMRPGETINVAGYDFKLVTVENNLQGPNYTFTRATFDVTKDGDPIAEMKPEKRLYATPPRPTTNAAIRTNLISDLYAVIGEPDNKGGYVTRLYHNPLVPWIFIGMFTIFFGGVVSLTDRRHRIGAPAHRGKAEYVASPSKRGKAETKIQRSRWIMLPIVGFAILVGFFTYRLQLVEEGNTPELIPSVLINKPTPPLDLPPLMPNKPGIKNADLPGKVTVLNFFASWCEPCRIEHSLLATLPKTIRLVGINYKDKPADAKKWLTERSDPYAALAKDATGRTGIDFGLYGVPETYVIDKRGVIRFKQVGPLTQDVINKTVIPLAKKLNDETP